MKKFGKLLLSVLMAASMVACSSSNSGNTETGTTQPSTNEQFDIVIIGAGGAGLSAAVQAHEKGAENIVVLEKMSFAGGSTTMAFGGFNCTTSRFMDEQGKEENPIDLTVRIMKNGKNLNDVRMAAVVAEETPEVIE